MLLQMGRRLLAHEVMRMIPMKILRPVEGQAVVDTAPVVPGQFKVGMKTLTWMTPTMTMP